MIRSILILLVIAGITVAQGDAVQPPVVKNAPIHDEEALAILEKLTHVVYRPRNSGLKTLTCALSVEIQVGSQKQSGKLALEWNIETGAKMRNEKGVEQPLGNLAPLVNDIVGHDTMALVKANHVDYLSDTTVRLRVPKWVKGSPVAHIKLHLSKAGLLERQELFTAQNVVFQSIRYRYRKADGRQFISERIYESPARMQPGRDGKPVKVPANKRVQKYGYATAGAFEIVSKITTEVFALGSGASSLPVSTQVVTISDVVCNGAADKKDAAPKKGVDREK